MKRPKHVLIQPFNYKITSRVDWTRDTGNSANCMSDDQLIIVDPNLSEAGMREVVLHEILHGIWAQTGLQKEYTEDQQESIIWTLAPRLYGFLKDNPEFLRWLCGR
jgi:hypothetical protein